MYYKFLPGQFVRKNNYMLSEMLETSKGYHDLKRLIGLTKTIKSGLEKYFEI